MKFRITLKDPDALGDQLAETATKQLEAIEGLDDDQRLLLHEKQCEKLHKIVDRWFSCGEYLTVEIDTDAKTATVVPVNDNGSVGADSFEKAVETINEILGFDVGGEYINGVLADDDGGRSEVYLNAEDCQRLAAAFAVAAGGLRQRRGS